MSETYDVLEEEKSQRIDKYLSENVKIYQEPRSKHGSRKVI